MVSMLVHQKVKYLVSLGTVDGKVEMGLYEGTYGGETFGCALGRFEGVQVGTLDGLIDGLEQGEVLGFEEGWNVGHF